MAAASRSRHRIQGHGRAGTCAAGLAPAEGQPGPYPGTCPHRGPVPAERHAPAQGEIARLVGALEAAIAASGERVKADAATIEALASDLAAERGRADRAEQGREAERARADALRDRMDVLQTQLTTMEAEGAESDVALAQLTAQLKKARLHAEGTLHAAETRLEAEATARRSLGRLARLRAAWRGSSDARHP